MTHMNSLPIHKAKADCRGKLDAFRWQAPAERLSAPVDPIPKNPAPLPQLPPVVVEPPALAPVAPPVLAEAPPPDPAPEPPPPETPVKAAEPSVAEEKPLAPKATEASSPEPATPSLAQEDALAKLAAIRRFAKTEGQRPVKVLPMITAPDDPGPEAPRR